MPFHGRTSDRYQAGGVKNGARRTLVSVAFASYDPPVDDRGGAVSGVLEGIAVVEREVGVLPGLDRAHSGFPPQDLCRVGRDRRQGLLEGEAVGRGQGGLEEDD